MALLILTALLAWGFMSTPLTPYESDLVLNEKNHIYHLDLHPDELANTIITVGDPDRVRVLSSYFDRIEVKRQHREFITHTGYIGQKRLTVLSTGIGVGNIDIVMNELDILANFDFDQKQYKDKLQTLDIIRLGTCGGLLPHIPLNGFVVSQYAIGMDGLLHFYKQQPNEKEESLQSQIEAYLKQKIHIKPYVAGGDLKWLKTFDFAHAGITLTSPGFYGPQGRILRAPLAYEQWIEHLQAFQFEGLGVANLEMETSALYGMSRLYGHRCCSLSLVVANRVTKQFSNQIPQGIKHLTELVLAKLEQA